MININKIYNENCLDTMANMPDNFIDLTVTSPPYDNLRDYKGYSFDFEAIAKELFRVTKNGGVVVWVVGDATINGSETGTSFRQALYFKDIGFNLHDTMIYEKHHSGVCGSNLSYIQAFEYMFVFSKGNPRSVNLIKDYISQDAGKLNRVVKHRSDKTGFLTDRKTITVPLNTYRKNVWLFNTGGKKSNNHPAIFPEKLARDHIYTWCDENDLVYDPFSGSGTTAKEAMLLNRNYIGSEISEEYCELTEKRLFPYKSQQRLFQ